MKTQTSETSLTWTRTMVAFSSVGLGFGYLISKGAFSTLERHPEDLLLLAFVLAVVVSPFVLRIRSIPAQIFGRAILLQAVLVCSLLLIYGVFWGEISAKKVFEITVALAVVAWPLGVIGRRGLSTNSKVFAPSAFRTTVIASLLFGLTDTWGLVFYSAVKNEVGPMMLCAGVMSVALFGLYHMKVWGLGLCVVANVVIAALALTEVFDLPPILAWGLVTTAFIQLLLPIPLLISMLKGARRQLVTSKD